MKAVILARISSQEQRDGHSLDAQVKNLKLYAERKQLEIVKEYTLIESSNRQQRPEFDEMINFIKDQEEKMTLIVDTVDRLQRSFRETPILNDLMQKDILEIHFVKEGNVLSKEANSSQKLMWNMGVVMAQSYTDQLSDNVKRSINFKIRSGEWCGPAPLGYINRIDSKTGKVTIDPDPDAYQIVQRIFSDYATGAFSLAELARKSEQWGLKSKRGNKIRTQQIHKLIQNPFYYGVMLVKGELYPHKYSPLITKATFESCQDVLKTRGRTQAVKETRYPFLFRGLIECATSGRRVTSTLQKKKYTYLICRDPENSENKLWVKEENVKSQIEKAIQRIIIPKASVRSVMEFIDSTDKLDRANRQASLKASKEEIEKTDIQTDRLTDLLVEGVITKDVYDRKFSELQSKRKKIAALQQEHGENNEEYKTALKSLVVLISKAMEILKSSKTPEKRSLITLIFSNLRLSGGTLRYTLRKPFGLLSDLVDYQEWRPVRDLNPCCRRERAVS